MVAGRRHLPLQPHFSLPSPPPPPSGFNQSIIIWTTHSGRGGVKSPPTCMKTLREEGEGVVEEGEEVEEGSGGRREGGEGEGSALCVCVGGGGGGGEGRRGWKGGKKQPKRGGTWREEGRHMELKGTQRKGKRYGREKSPCLP